VSLNIGSGDFALDGTTKIITFAYSY